MISLVRFCVQKQIFIEDDIDSFDLNEMSQVLLSFKLEDSILGICAISFSLDVSLVLNENDIDEIIMGYLNTDKEKGMKFNLWMRVPTDNYLQIDDWNNVLVMSKLMKITTKEDLNKK